MASACHVCAAVLVRVARSRRSEPLLDERSLKLRAKTGGNLASYLIYQRYDNDLDSRNVYYVEKVSFVLQFTSV